MKNNKEILEKIENINNKLNIFLKVNWSQVTNETILTDFDLLKCDVNELKQLIQAEDKEDNKLRFVEGMVVNVWNDDRTRKEINIYSWVTHNFTYDNIKPIDFPTLARTIAYHIPEAVKAVLYEAGGIGFYCKNDAGFLYNIIPHPNPSKTRQEIEIKRNEG